MAEPRQEADQRLMQWLRDAHAMEKQAETMLSGIGRCALLGAGNARCGLPWLSSSIDPLTAECLEREERGSDRAKR